MYTRAFSILPTFMALRLPPPRRPQVGRPSEEGATAKATFEFLRAQKIVAARRATRRAHATHNQCGRERQRSSHSAGLFMVIISAPAPSAGPRESLELSE
jgi:hypothetical protein